MDAKVFGAFLKERRAALDLTQAELAEKLNVTAKAVSRWERGVGFPDIQSLEPLAEALGISLLELMQSRVIREDTVSSEEASAALANTVEIIRQHTGEAKKSPLWIISLVFSIPLIIAGWYLVSFHIETRWAQGMAHHLLLVAVYTYSSTVLLLIRQLQHPGSLLISTRWPYLAAVSARLLGLVLLVAVYPIWEFWGKAWFIAALAAVCLLEIGSWLCFAFWKDYPEELQGTSDKIVGG